MIQFHETRLGRMFYERDVPELVRQLQRLNEALERIAEGFVKSEPQESETTKDPGPVP